VFRYLIISAALFLNISIQAELRVGVISSGAYVGEREVGWRIKIAGENLGWTMILDEKEGKNLKKMRDLDFVICLLPGSTVPLPTCYVYQTIFHPFNYLDEERIILPVYKKYDGYLLTIRDRCSILKSFRLKNKKFNFISFYPTVPKVSYQKNRLNSLVTMLPNWSNRLTDEKFKTIYTTLSTMERVNFYGSKSSSGIVQNGYLGTIPFDGISVINVLQKHGIALIFHSDIHNKEEIPTSRIFEAAAASAVIICDQNSFVKEQFGDSVFYIDTTLSAEEICLQIQNHLKTIWQDPERSLEMAKTAHQIFTDKFLMEDQLLHLEQLNKKIKLEGPKLKWQNIFSF